MKVVCPTCHRSVDAEDVNVATDVAFCKGCEDAFSISGLLFGLLAPPPQSISLVDPNKPPKGAWFVRTFDGFELGATTRSAIAFFLVPFMCVWSGGSLGGIIGSQIAAGEFNLVISLVGIPFLIGSVIFWTVALMAVAGKVVVTVQRGEGIVFTGVGPIGLRQRFDWRQMQAAGEAITGKNQTEIVLDGATRVAFGSSLNEKRRYYVLGVLRKLLAEKQRPF